MKSFRSFKSLEKYIQKCGSEDYFKVEGNIYTMDYYDFEGLTIGYGCIKAGLGFYINTDNNRYTNGFKNAEVEVFDLVCYRNDINYIE